MSSKEWKFVGLIHAVMIGMGRRRSIEATLCSSMIYLPCIVFNSLDYLDFFWSVVLRAGLIIYIYIRLPLNFYSQSPYTDSNIAHMFYGFIRVCRQYFRHHRRFVGQLVHWISG